MQCATGSSRSNARQWPNVLAKLPALIIVLALLTAGCSTPVGVQVTDPQTVHHELTRNVLSTGNLSAYTEIVLRQLDLTEQYAAEPTQALATLHAAMVTGLSTDSSDPDSVDRLFALAELSFQHALTRHQAPYYLAASVYAYAFMFPDDAALRPNPFDPRLRLAADLYNRGITAGFTTGQEAEVELRAGRYPLPFGELQLSLDPAQLYWNKRQFTHFVAAADLVINGLINRYRRTGIGAPLVASTTIPEPGPEAWDIVAPRAKVPVSVLLRINNVRQQLLQTRLQAALEIYSPSDAAAVTIDQQEIPLESEPSAALAYGLSTSRSWEWEYKGFLFGDLLSKEKTRLAAIEPYRPGRYPVVFVHGTASSPGRWADMLNDLQSDPLIRERFQFWFFFYDTGNPILHSALVLRESLQEAISQLDPNAQDQALQRMVVIGHSQGGLLTKMTAISSGDWLWDQFSRQPLDALTLSPEDRDLLQRAFFIEPLPFVKRLVFIATPHRGSYVAGNWISQQIARLVQLPGNILRVTSKLATQNPDAFPATPVRAGSVYAMTPGSTFVKALSPLPIAPGVGVHSIVAVRGDGPPEGGSDGVVEYSSAHLEDADSELVVRSGHSTQSNPHTIQEVRRVLLLHADES